MATAGDTTTIGRTVRIRGRVTGTADLEIEGYVEGEVTLEGELTIGEHGRVGANVRARSVIVRGAIRGDLHADDVIRLEAGARVVGDVRAPRVSIAPGAKVRGFVQTAGAGGSASRGATRATAGVSSAASAKSEARHTSSSSTSAASSNHRAAPAPAQAPVAAPVVARPAPAATPTIKQAAAPAAPVAHAPTHRSGPPAPVVPVIKKAKGQLTKKRGE